MADIKADDQVTVAFTGTVGTVGHGRGANRRVETTGADDRWAVVYHDGWVNIVPIDACTLREPKRLAKGDKVRPRYDPEPPRSTIFRGKSSGLVWQHDISLLGWSRVGADGGYLWGLVPEPLTVLAVEETGQ